MANVNVKEEAFPELTKKVNSTKGLKCGHLNVNGLLSKIDQIRTLLNESKLHILAISETHLSDETSDDELSIENYLFERKDRENRKNHWGGVLIYYANYLIVDEVVYNANTGITELLFIDIMLRNERLLLACIYRPKEDKKFINTLEIMMTSFSHRKSVLLLGDFNIDLFKDSSLVAALERAMYTNNLTNMIKEATRITETSSTLIDLALTTNPSYVNNNGSFNTCISDHNLIYTTFKVFYKQRKLPKLITVKNKKNIDLNKLKYDLECTPWLLIDLFDDPGPDCFSTHVNDMPEETTSDTDVEDSELNLFADDSTAYEFGNSVDDTFDKLAETVKNIELYARKNSLTIHPGKCKILVISKQKFVGPLKAINIYNKPVEVVHSTKCLGVTIDRNLSWEPHISNVCKKFNAKVKKLFKLRIMSTNVLNTIYFQGILPAALYSILIWGSSTHLPDVNKIHIKAARFIMKIKKDIPDHMVLQHAGWKPIDHYYKRSLACKAYKIYNGLSPDPLNCLLTKSHARKNRNLFKTELPKFNYVPFKKSFRYRGSNVWNVLSNDLRGKPTFESFKNQLRKEDLGKITFGSLATGKAKYHNDFLYF